MHTDYLSLIYAYYGSLERQGPGSESVTQQALAFIPNLEELRLIADIGCGTGGQTMTLLEQTQAEVHALDLGDSFIAQLKDKAQARGSSARLQTHVASMEQLPFAEESLDLIWSEGAIYNIGFEQGIKDWHAYLKSGGYLAVSEITWITEVRPDRIEEYWTAAYPGIDTMAAKVAQLQAAGYRMIAAFSLPKAAWTASYYAPQKAVQAQFRQQYASNEYLEAFLEEQQQEELLFEEFSDYYNYVFYIAQKL